jgi:hypothetical protein
MSYRAGCLSTLNVARRIMHSVSGRSKTTCTAGITLVVVESIGSQPRRIESLEVVTLSRAIRIGNEDGLVDLLHTKSRDFCRRTFVT